MDDFDRSERNDSDLFSKPVKAGKRTYFFDVKATRDNDYYLTITESRRRVDRDGKFTYDKHKIFLYKEDFEKFADGMKEAVDYIKQNCPEVEERPRHNDADAEKPSGYSDVSFDDLGSK
ncbi:MAG: PUR family DNA/RNA-binding protein [Prevotellaceae bacterium]|nr:PUR family DNA/RNA-binding protein [Prevotellaceae bacterium]